MSGSGTGNIIQYTKKQGGNQVIGHLGALGTNVTNPVLTDIPENSTNNNSTGNYIFKKDGNYILLNNSGSDTGGFTFCNVGTNAPSKQLLTIDREKISTAGSFVSTDGTHTAVLTSTSLTFDGIPVTGATGPQGIQGVTGATGPTGPQGDISVPTNTVLFSSDGTTIEGNTNMTYSSFGGGLDPTLQLGTPLSYTPTIQTEITASATYTGTYSALTAQNLNPNGSVNLYLSMDNATETSHYTVLGLNNSTYNGAPYISEAVEMTYLASLEGGIAIAPNFNGNSNKYNAVHLGYAGGTKAVSILADGSISLNTAYSAGNWTGNVGTAGDILTSGGEGQPAVWSSVTGTTGPTGANGIDGVTGATGPAGPPGPGSSIGLGSTGEVLMSTGSAYNWVYKNTCQIVGSTATINLTPEDSGKLFIAQSSFDITGTSLFTGFYVNIYSDGPLYYVNGSLLIDKTTHTHYWNGSSFDRFP